MKPVLILVAACLVFSSAAVQAQNASPEDEYFDVYTLMQKGESLQSRGKPAQAHTNYVNAETALKKLQQDFPLWQPQVVKYRFSYLQSKVAETAPEAKPAAPTAVQPTVSEVITPGDPTEPVALNIKWQVGKRYLMTVEQGLNRDASGPGAGKAAKPASASTMNLAVNVLKERDGGGQELELEGIVLKSDGRIQTNNPLADAHIKYLADANGKIESVENYHEVRDQMAAGLPAEVQDMVKKSLTEKSLMDLVSVGDGLPGKPVKTGDTWSEKTGMSLPGTTGGEKQPVEVKYKFAGWATHEQQKCAVVEFAGEAASPSGGVQATGAAGSLQVGKVNGKLWFNPEAGIVVEEAANVTYTIPPNTARVNQTTDIKVVVTDMAK
jgi:hypothetical protein